MSKANTNYHTLSEGSVFDSRLEERFIEYREKWYNNPKNFILEDFPIHLDIESTYRCNLKCPFCARTHKGWGEPSKVDLDFDLYTKIIDEGIKNNLYSVKLNIRGEPLLHDRIIDMIEYAKRKGIIDIYINTNAVLLNKIISEKLISSGLDRISISFDGLDEQEYQENRFPANYNFVIKNIKLFKFMRDMMKRNYPKIRIQTLKTPSIEGRLEEYADFWKGIADEIGYLDMREEKPDDIRLAKPANWSCPFLWQRMGILSDGIIIPCLLHGVSKIYSLGNIEDTSIKDAWNSDDMNRFRKYHKNNKSHQIPMCSECSYRELETSKLDISNFNR